MKNLKKQSVFIILLAVALVIVGSVAAVAIYKNLQDTDDKDQSSTKETDKDNKSTPSEKEQPERSVADWTVLTTDKYTTPIPDGWKLKKSIVDFENTPQKDNYNKVTEETLMNFSDLNYKKGVPASVKEVQTKGTKGTGPENSLLLMGYAGDVSSKIKEISTDKDEVTKDTTSNGDTLHASVKTFKEDTPSVREIKKGMHMYWFVVQKRDSTAGVEIMYIVEPGMTDYSAQFQKALMQFKFI